MARKGTKMKRVNTIWLVAVVIISASGFAGTYSGGSGDPNDPYLIGNADDIIEMSGISDDWDKHFLMIADVNMIDYVFTKAVIAPDVNDVQNGFQGTSFEGSFDGADHAILNLTIDTAGAETDYLGLFGNIIGGQTQVRNLVLENVSITGGIDSWNVGGLSGRNTGEITNCYVSGAVSGYRAIGVLCGINQATIRQCSSDGQVSGGINVGGLCGYNSDTIRDCSSTGLVTGGVESNSVGGLCGYDGQNGTVTNSYSECSVSGDYRVGGLCGHAIGTISKSYATGSVTGLSRVGGLCGQSGIINDCYSECSVAGKVDSDYIGGLVGWNFATISNCYSIGSVSSTGSYVGGLCGSDEFGVMISNCFWDEKSSGPDNGLGIPLPTTGMQSRITFTDAGWDFIDIWNIGENQTYPYLRTYSPADMNKDGIVNLLDFTITCERWLEER
jgi:hypothetical protein